MEIKTLNDERVRTILIKMGKKIDPTLSDPIYFPLKDVNGYYSKDKTDCFVYFYDMLLYIVLDLNKHVIEIEKVDENSGYLATAHHFSVKMESVFNGCI